MRPFLFLLLACAAAIVARSATLHLRSNVAQTSLIELFTSEGCSSCPPAERWFATLRDAPGLWRDFVPVALHVDYWNRLGWPDRFSSKANTQREYAYAAAWRSDSVYTPCFVRDGAEWRGRRELSPTGVRVGVLDATYDGATLRAHFSPTERTTGEEFEIHAALLGGGISSKVTAGENRGETLRHEFVALALASGAPDEAIALPRTVPTSVPRLALAVWVTRRGELTPLQAAGRWIERASASHEAADKDVARR